MARPIPVFTRAALAALTSVLVLLVAACGDEQPRAEPAASAAGTTGGLAVVAIQTFQFQPSPLEIHVGTTVSWANQDDILHTVTAGAPGAVDGRFDGMLDGPATLYQFTFSEAGTYAYFCSRHESMRGEVRVR